LLIGDILTAARVLMPDLPRTLPPPTGLAAAAVAAGGSTLPAGTYTVIFTFTNQWGETLPSAAVTGVVIGANQGIQVTAPAFNTNPSATGCRAYFALTGQPYVQFQAATVIPFTISTPGIPGTPPSRNTSFYPDSDGPFLSAYSLYDWLNDALTVAAYVCKGIPDMSGVQLFSGQGMYVMPGIWDKFENCWYDGFPVAFDARSGAFYRNVLSGITFIAILQMNSDRQILEFQPQPSRSAGTTTTSGSIGIADTSIPLTAIANIGLALGMVSLGTSPNNEIISYSTLSGNNLTGCVRGMGGTQQFAWPNGTPVSELNFRFGGLRLNQQVKYIPGNSSITLQVPPGWKPALVDYLVGKFREGEQNGQGAGASLQKFTTFLKDNVRGTKQTAGPRQVGSSTPAGDGYPSASSGGRIIVP
jgi:hypothetical protein